MNKRNSLTACHAGVLYAADPATLLQQVTCPSQDMCQHYAGSLPVVALVPIASYTHILDILQQTFWSLQHLHIEHVYIVSKLHRPPIDAHATNSIYIPKVSHSETMFGPLQFEFEPLVGFCNHISINLTMLDAYFKEEFCFELLYPFIMHQWPSASVTPLLLPTSYPNDFTLLQLFKAMTSVNDNAMILIAMNLEVDPTIHEPSNYPLLSMFGLKWNIIASKAAPVERLWYAGALKEFR